MNFKMECFSSLLVTMNTEVIIFNIRLITKLDHEIQDQWHLAPLLVYNSIHPSPGAFDLVYFTSAFISLLFLFSFQNKYVLF